MERRLPVGHRPLDGTTNYLHGFPQFAISIALMHRGRLESAVVYDPLRDEMFTADRGAGALLNDRRLRVTSKDPQRRLLGTGIPFRDQRYIDAYLGMLKDLTKETAGIRRPVRRRSISPTWPPAVWTDSGNSAFRSGISPPAPCWCRRPAGSSVT